MSLNVTADGPDGALLQRIDSLEKQLLQLRAGFGSLDLAMTGTGTMVSAAGSGGATYVNSSTLTITHNLGYVPIGFFYAFDPASSYSFQIVPGTRGFTPSIDGAGNVLLMIWYETVIVSYSDHIDITINSWHVAPSGTNTDPGSPYHVRWFLFHQQGT